LGCLYRAIFVILGEDGKLVGLPFCLEPFFGCDARFEGQNQEVRLVQVAAFAGEGYRAIFAAKKPELPEKKVGRRDFWRLIDIHQE
jgi:hypothetical protein